MSSLSLSAVVRGPVVEQQSGTLAVTAVGVAGDDGPAREVASWQARETYVGAPVIASGTCHVACSSFAANVP